MGSFFENAGADEEKMMKYHRKRVYLEGRFAGVAEFCLQNQTFTMVFSLKEWRGKMILEWLIFKGILGAECVGFIAAANQVWDLQPHSVLSDEARCLYLGSCCMCLFFPLAAAL